MSKRIMGEFAYWDDVDFYEGAKLQVTIKSVDVEWVKKPGGKGQYGKATVSYDYNGNARQQKVMSFSNPDVFKKVQELTGETVEVEVGKNDKDFTEWRNITALSGFGVASASSPTGPARTTNEKASTNSYTRDFETKEERAVRQKLIVKQSSLSAAVATLTPGAKKELDADAVLKLAKDYFHWVFEDDKDAGFDDMDNDIPF